MRASEKARMGKSLVYLGTASNLSGWDSASEGRRVNGLHEAQGIPGAQSCQDFFDISKQVGYFDQTSGMT